MQRHETRVIRPPWRALAAEASPSPRRRRQRRRRAAKPAASGQPERRGDLLRVLAQDARQVRGVGVQDARRRAGDADRRQRQPGVVEDRRRDAGDAELVLLVVGAVAAAADAREVLLQRVQRGQRLGRGGRERHAAEQRLDVAGSRQASSALPAPECAAGIARPISVNSRTLRVPGHAVDVDDVAALEDDEVGRLAGLGLDRLQVRPRGGAQALRGGPAGRWSARAACSRAGSARWRGSARRSRARRACASSRCAVLGHQTGLGRDVGHAELVRRGERLEQVERPVERLDALCGHCPQSVPHVPRCGLLLCTRTGVPTPTSRPSRRTSALRSRTQPLETCPPIAAGSFVPWIATWPPPSQSVR